MRAMPRLLRNVNDVSLFRQERRDGVYFVFDLAFENEPELTGNLVEMSFVFRIIALRISTNDICKGAIVYDEAFLLEHVRCDHRVEVKVRFVDFVVFPLAADADLDELHSRDRGGRF